MNKLCQLLPDFFFRLYIMIFNKLVNSYGKILFYKFYKKIVTVLWVMPRNKIHLIKKIWTSECELIDDFLSRFLKKQFFHAVFEIQRGFKLCFCIFTNVHNFFLRMIQGVFFFKIYPIIFSVFVVSMLQSKLKTSITRQANTNTFNNKTADIFYNITIIFIKINV